MCTTCGSIQTSEAEQTHLQVYLEVKHYQNDLHNNDINNYTGKGFEIMYNKYINRRTIIWKQWGLLHHVRTIIYVKELFIMS